MKSLARPSFWRLYHALDPRVRRAARRAHLRFVRDADHPSLHFKKLKGHSNAWSVRVNDGFRAVGQRTGDTIEWAWIGSHNDFDNLFG